MSTTTTPTTLTLSQFATQNTAGSSPALDARSFAEVVHQTHVTLLELATGLLGDRERAEDVVQDVLLAAYASFAPGSNLGKLAARLRQLVSQRCQLELRGSGQVQVEYAGVHLTLAAPGRSVGVDEEAELPLEQELIALALQSLPGRFRTPLELRYLEGLSLAETGRVLRMKEGVLRKRLAASLRHLKRALAVLLAEGVPTSARLAA
jgi:RNA polymerase sigma-70 factor (ECF subfamily)